MVQFNQTSSDTNEIAFATTGIRWKNTSEEWCIFDDPRNDKRNSVACKYRKIFSPPPSTCWNLPSFLVTFQYRHFSPIFPVLNADSISIIRNYIRNYRKSWSKTGHAFASVDEDPLSVERKLNFIFPPRRIPRYHRMKTKSMDAVDG